MAVDLPPTTKIQGNWTVFVVPESGILDPTAPTAAEINGGFKATCYIYGDETLITREQGKVDLPMKACEVKSREALDTVKESMRDIQYSYMPQGGDADEGNEMKAAAVPGTRVYTFERLGVLDETPAVAGDVFDVALVTLGTRNKGRAGDGSAAEAAITQGGSVENTWEDVVVAAGV
jgi:hypothetical protein